MEQSYPLEDELKAAHEMNVSVAALQLCVSACPRTVPFCSFLVLFPSAGEKLGRMALAVDM